MDGVTQPVTKITRGHATDKTRKSDFQFLVVKTLVTRQVSMCDYSNERY